MPRLTTLVLERHDSERAEFPRRFGFRAVLDSRPRLTSLHCFGDVHLDISDLLIIASHSTLEELRIDTVSHDSCNGDDFSVPGDGDSDEEEAELSDEELLTGEVEAVVAAVASIMAQPSERPSGSAEEMKEEEETRAELQRMRAALTRTDPSKSSISTRLALADRLHRRLERGDDLSVQQSSDAMLRRYHKQVALLRYTLRQQAGARQVRQREPRR